MVTVHIRKSTDKVGRIQRRAEKSIIGNKNVSCEDRVKYLNILEKERYLFDVTFLCKGLNGHLNLDLSTLLNCYSQALDPYNCRRDDDYSLKSNLFRISKCKYNNFNRIVKIWNSIPLQVRLTPSLGAFKFGVNVIINMAGDWEGVELVVF